MSHYREFMIELFDVNRIIDPHVIESLDRLE